ncbi:MAG: hypothetical protein ACYS0I_01220 [Planctomycetota bacterium]
MKRCKSIFAGLLIVCLMAVTVTPVPVSAAFAEDADADGIYDDLTESTSLTVSSTVLSGYNVLVTGDEDYIGKAATRIRNLGASVTEAAASTLTSGMLAQYDVVWISLSGADDVDNAGKADIVKSYVYNGGGLILEQPNVVMTPQCLPYAFPIVDRWYYNSCTGTILVPDHYLTEGLTIEDNEIPATGDEAGTIGPEWLVLAIDGDTTDPDPKLSVACYGTGRIIVELGATTTRSCVCGVCMEDVMIERMITWVATTCAIEVAIDVDIKPGSCPNPVNVKSKGVLPVAVLGAEGFDVNMIDVASVRLAGVAPIRSSYEDVAAPVAEANDCNCTEEGPDGYTDLTLKFKTQEIVGALGDVNDRDVVPLTLEVVLQDETPIEGVDCIVVRGKSKPPKRGDINEDGVVDFRDLIMLANDWLKSDESE